MKKNALFISAMAMMFVSQAVAADLFVTKIGTGTTCTQASPCSLQTAIAQATGGETIYVAGGTYTGTGSTVIQIDKSISLRGGWNGGSTGQIVCDPSTHVTTLDGEDTRQVVYIDGANGSIAVTLEGFVITRGNTQLSGAGIGTDSATSIIRNNRIVGNLSSLDGGGVFINRGSAQILSNRIIDNQATWAGGLRIINDADVTLIGNEIVGNTAVISGGGIDLGCCGNTTPLIAGNFIANNNGGVYGGGLQVDTTNTQFINNIVVYNRATHGAAIWLDGMAGYSSNVQVIHNTLLGDKTGGEAIGVGDYVNASALNNIISGHNLGITNPVPATSIVSADSNLFWDNQDDGFRGTNPVDGNPLFVDPSAGNYHIGVGSAALNAGTGTSVTSDVDDDPRNDGLPDIGADEFFPVKPKEGTLGTEIVFRNFKFSTKKGKASIGKAALKVIDWTEGFIRCQLTKALAPGTHTVTIASKGAPSIVIPDGFTPKEPEMDSVSPTHGSAGEEVTINGYYFGTKKGKVTLGGKNCKVLNWEMNPTTGESSIRFVVPKGLSPGTHDLNVSTKGVGSDVVSFDVD